MSIVSSVSSSTTTSAVSSTYSLTADDFLTLLLTELENQDPTDPCSTADMISEFSDLSMISQSETTNSYLESLLDYASAGSSSQALSYLDRTVSYSGDSITVSGGSCTAAGFTLSSDASDVTATIYNSSGSVVRTVDLGSMSAGSYTYSWDGTNSSGSTVSDGTYTVKYTATDSSGSSVTVTAGGSAAVTGIVYRSGVAYLVTDQGEIPLSSVTAVS
jgi:flagellar basal-body rod modification protein FlgD